MARRIPHVKLIATMNCLREYLTRTPHLTRPLPSLILPLTLSTTVSSIKRTKTSSADTSQSKPNWRHSEVQAAHLCSDKEAQVETSEYFQLRERRLWWTRMLEIGHRPEVINFFEQHCHQSICLLIIALDWLVNEIIVIIKLKLFKNVYINKLLEEVQVSPHLRPQRRAWPLHQKVQESIKCRYLHWWS